ncbi:MAG: putative phage abortive infection protein [Bacteroidota bacterium]
MFNSLIEIWKSLESKEKKYLKSGLIYIGLIGFISIFILPFILTRNLDFVNFNKTGPVGDTINGIAGPFIALLAAVLTFLAFYIQFKANNQQRDQFNHSLEEQKRQYNISRQDYILKESSDLNTRKIEQEAKDKLWQIERFENKFYELLKLHKANVDEMNIADVVEGRKCFVPMFYELRYCFNLVEEYKMMRSNVDSKNINTLSLAYKIFFFGIGFYSEKNYSDSLNDDEKIVFKDVKDMIVVIKNTFEKRNKEQRIPLSKLTQNMAGSDGSGDFLYTPYEGHVNRLGHYYRHLFQTAKFIIDQNFSESEKYGYMKMLRAQLSNFEQLLLYYNALAWFEVEWKEIFTTYRLIKNLPIPLADFSIKPLEKYEDEIKEMSAKGTEMFEYLE